jgi:hypothetical protein
VHSVNRPSSSAVDRAAAWLLVMGSLLGIEGVEVSERGFDHEP